MTPGFEAVEIDIGGLDITGIRHRDTNLDSEVRLLCLHGWLDNAASYLPLMPYLPAIDLVAIDLPGHGYSSHVPDNPFAGYTLFDYAHTALRIMDALDWSHCHLAGHSLGGCVAPILAVAKPDRIQSLLLIEAAGPLAEDADQFPARLQRALDDRTTPARFNSRRFDTKDDAVAARLAAAKMEQASARLVIDRQVIKDDSGQWRWRFDPALRHASPQYQTEEQVHAVLGAVSCPTLAIMADEGFLTGRDVTRKRLDCLKTLTQVDLPGHHHLHMDTPEPVAAAINRFLGTTPALGG